jgi:hypothetical protein
VNPGADREPDSVLRTALVWREPEMLVARFLPGADVDLADARECLAAGARLTDGRAVPVLVDLRPIRSQTAEARAHFASVHTRRVATAVALVIASPVSRVIGNFFLRLNQPEAPTRLFESEEEARAWLREFAAGQRGDALPGGPADEGSGLGR